VRAILEFATGTWLDVVMLVTGSLPASGTSERANTPVQGGVHSKPEYFRLISESNGSGIAETSRKLGLDPKHPILGEFSCFSGTPHLGASWKSSDL
jgi:hypothetical protein